MSEKEVVETSESQIAVHWQEEDYYLPSEEFVAQANVNDKSIYDRFSLKHFPECFKEYAELLDWDHPWHTTLDTSDAPCWKWFVGGKLNVSYNCIDRHLAKNKNKTAIHFVPDSEEDRVQHITYQELYVRVNEVAALLRDFCGLKAGDRVTLHLPMTAELPITMLARTAIIAAANGLTTRKTPMRPLISASRKDIPWRRSWSGSVIPANTPAIPRWLMAGIIR
jgi:acetyl-CoA synthetase